MSVPASLYGRYKEVLPRCCKMITALKKGQPWDTVIGADPLVDVAALDGLLVLDGPYPLVGGAPHVQIYLPMRLLYEAFLDRKMAPDMAHVIFEACRQTAWGTLPSCRRALGCL